MPLVNSPWPAMTGTRRGRPGGRAGDVGGRPAGRRRRQLQRHPRVQDAERDPAVGREDGQRFQVGRLLEHQEARPIRRKRPDRHEQGRVGEPEIGQARARRGIAIGVGRGLLDRQAADRDAERGELGHLLVVAGNEDAAAGLAILAEVADDLADLCQPAGRAEDDQHRLVGRRLGQPATDWIGSNPFSLSR